MDVRARYFIFIIFSFLLTACGEPDFAETVMPKTTETCGGSALQSKYIVRLKNGDWQYIENSNRENFKEIYVRKNLEQIDFIEYDQKISTKQQSAQLQQSSGIDNWGASSISAESFWQKNKRGQGVLVAVIDTGVDINHPQLKSQIYENKGEVGLLSSNGIDDDKNGYVDDVAGFNFYDNTSDVSDSEGHGTHVAGIIAAHHSDNQTERGYVQGVAPEAKILPIKFLGADGGTLSDAMRGIDYAVQQGAKIINASWGGPGCSQSLKQKMTDLAAQNILFVVAAGNSGVNLDIAPEYPAAFNLSLQLTVGALSERLNLDHYSNYSRGLVHIFAPGSGVVSTMPNESYASLSGTSMAAPFVAGAAALILSAQPEMTLAEVRQNILTNVDTDKNYVNSTNGRLNLQKIANAMGL